MNQVTGGRPLRQKPHTNQSLRRFFCFDHQNNHQTRQGILFDGGRSTGCRASRSTSPTPFMRSPLVRFAVCDGARATVRIRPGGVYRPTARVVLIQVGGPTLRIKIETLDPVGLKILKISFSHYEVPRTLQRRITYTS